MTIDFDSLMARQTVADIRTSMIAACEVVGFYVARLPGLSRLRKMALDAVPAIVNTATGINADAIRGGLLDYAEGVWLELLAVNLYGITAGRIKETFATTAVTFTNPDNTPYNFADGEVRVGNGFVEYTAPSFELAATGNDGDTVTVDVTCKTAGTSGSTAATTITQMITTFGGVTCTNPAAAKGTDEETDEQLRERCRLSRAALSNAGHVAAIEFVARSAVRADGTAIGVTRVQVVENADAIGDVAVFLAGPSGEVAPEDVERIDHLLRTLVIPTGVNYIGTFEADSVTVNITHTSRYKVSAGYSEAELVAMTSAALAEMFATYPIGGYIETPPDGNLYRQEIAATISSVHGDDSDERPIKSTTVSTPSTDVELNPGEVAILGAITHNWVQIPG